MRCSKCIIKNGFSQIELLVAFALSAFVITASIYLAAQSTSSVGNQQMAMQAYLIMQNMGESFMIGSGGLQLTDQQTQTQYFNVQGQMVPNGPIRIDWTVAPDGDLYRISMAATWSSGGSRYGSNSLNMVFYRAPGITPGGQGVAAYQSSPYMVSIQPPPPPPDPPSTEPPSDGPPPPSSPPPDDPPPPSSPPPPDPPPWTSQ